jgi:electron-transferring-flavoprotein dehydrogenase
LDPSYQSDPTYLSYPSLSDIIRLVSERERLDLDILIVGGGPAGVSAAVELARLQRAHGTSLAVAVLDKAPEAGSHVLSGAVLDPSVLRELVPDFLARGAPLGCPVVRDTMYVLTERRRWRVPFTPPPLVNHGCHVISLSTFVKWLTGIAEEGGIDVINGFAAAEVLYEGTSVVGVRTRDLGLDRQGQATPAFQPGVDVRAKVTIFCDGVRGNLTKTLVRDRGLDQGRQPQVYALGLKELWELRPGRLEAGEVIHTLGFPIGLREFGGGFLYGMADGLAAVGLVAGLDYRDPYFDPHAAFQSFKQHPFVSELLEDGVCIRYGAKALPEGGWHAVPRVHLDGALIAGDAGGFLNSLRLKGIHLAMRTGMLAADAAFAALRAGDVSEAGLRSYQQAIDAGDVRRELYPVRNVHQAFSHGLVPGLAFAGWSLVSGGWWFRNLPAGAGHERMTTIAESRAGMSRIAGPGRALNRDVAFDRATSVHLSGTRHREDQPAHLIVHDTDICRTRCKEKFDNPCTRFCPASVYEMVDDGRGGRRLQINASNCVHCRTCDIMDPYQIIDWVPPEGGEGPRYTGM